MSKKRIGFIILIIIILFLIIIFRIYNLIILKNEYYKKRLEQKTKIVIEGPTPLREWSSLS